MAGIVAKNYCDAIFTIAQEDDKLDLYKEQLMFVDFSMMEANFYEIIGHPKISRVQKKEMLERVFQESLDPTLLNFLKLLIDKNHFKAMHEIVKEFIKNYNEVNRIQVVYVRSAVSLKDEEIKRLSDALETKLNKKIDMRITVDEDLIAGIRVKINDMVLDNSALARLERMHRDIATNKI